MSKRRLVIVGGGAAGFFAAIVCAESAPDLEVILLEKTGRFLDKVRISGGGRCNVTHACFEPREFATKYPRGEGALIAPLQRFSARESVAWFAARGVPLKTEPDGRMFPTTDSSQTIVDCLVRAARNAGVQLRLHAGVSEVQQKASGGFEMRVESGPGKIEMLTCEALLLATGGCRAASAGQLAVSLGHALVPPVPSLFTFQINTPWLKALSGVSVGDVELAIPAIKLRERGPLLITHWGLSGPAVLRLSAWGARKLHDLNYEFPLLVNWLPGWDAARLNAELDAKRGSHPAKFIVGTPIPPIPARLWEQLVQAAGFGAELRWSSLAKSGQTQLLRQLNRCEFAVIGKSLNKDEFVTCGGVALKEVNFKTMESRLCPGLYFAGELLDFDGITGGFNFQAAWTTGWIAGQALAGRG